MNRHLSIVLAGLIGILFASGCSSNSVVNNSVASNSPSQFENNTSLSNVSQENTTSSSTITPPNSGLKQWRYGSGTGQQFSQALYGTSFNAFYLPVSITKGDSFEGFEANKNVVTVHFKDMTLIQSTNSINPSGTVKQAKVITLPILISKVTVYTMADESLTLSIHEPIGTYILLSSASIPLSQLEAILQHMSPLNG